MEITCVFAGIVVFANCSQNKNQHFLNLRNLLIFTVDQLGLEPRTSRL